MQFHLVGIKQSITILLRSPFAQSNYFIKAIIIFVFFSDLRFFIFIMKIEKLQKNKSLSGIRVLTL